MFPRVMASVSPTPVDRAFQLAYVCAYRVMRTYWSLRHPKTHGALIALFNAGELLLVRNSYVPYYTLPGGYVESSETGRDAAQRELREEVNLTLSAEQLELALDEHHEWEGKREHIEIYTVELAERPVLRIDNREVIDAAWFKPERALELDLFPPIRRVLELRRVA
ncbi:MAG TPA: NUDIX hydrolase [Polyangiaceae bacterium]|nr:NUDIX hydrolase [Polyangiaceae bacterium]